MCIGHDCKLYLKAWALQTRLWANASAAYLQPPQALLVARRPQDPQQALLWLLQQVQGQMQDAGQG